MTRHPVRCRECGSNFGHDEGCTQANAAMIRDALIAGKSVPDSVCLTRIVELEKALVATREELNATRDLAAMFAKDRDVLLARIAILERERIAEFEKGGV